MLRHLLAATFPYTNLLDLFFPIIFFPSKTGFTQQTCSFSKATGFLLCADRVDGSPPRRRRKPFEGTCMVPAPPACLADSKRSSWRRGGTMAAIYSGAAAPKSGGLWSVQRSVSSKVRRRIWRCHSPRSRSCGGRADDKIVNISDLQIFNKSIGTCLRSGNRYILFF